MNEALPFPYLGSEDRPLNGELHLPDGTGPHPVVVLVPGGGWRTCVPSHLKHWGQWLASKGYAALCIEHATSVSSSDGVFTLAVNDVRSALGHLKRMASDYGLDSDRVSILGESSGATLAFLVALGKDSRETPEGGVPEIKAAIGIYGTYDMAARWRSQLAFNEPAGKGLCKAFLGADLYDNQQLYVDASPAAQVTYDACRGLGVLLVWGDADPLVPPTEQSERFARILREARNAVQTYSIAGAGHFWFQTDPVEEPGSPNAFLAPRLARFLQRALA